MNKNDELYKEEFLKKKKIRNITMILNLTLCLVSMILMYTIHSDFLFLILLFMIISVIINLSVWKCPKCSKLFHKEWNPHYCSKCGLKLQ